MQVSSMLSTSRCLGRMKRLGQQTHERFLWALRWNRLSAGTLLSL